MIIGKMHGLLAEFSRKFSLGVLANDTIARQAQQSLAAHGKLAQRESPLHPQFVFWMVICMVLMRDRSIPAVFAALVNMGRELFPNLSRKAVSDGALAHARQRLSADVFATFFRATAQQSPVTPWFYGLRPRAVDGVRVTMPDTPANRQQFPLQKTGRGRAAWPQLRATCLVDIQTHAITSAAPGSIHEGEQTLVQSLWNDLSPSDLVVEDRGFFSADDFWQLNQHGRKFLCRMPKSVKPRLLQKLGPGDYLVELVFRRPLEPRETPAHHRGRPGKTKKVRLMVRLIEYKLKGFRDYYRLVTNVFDTVIRPKEFASIYHWRWDAEITFDELKTHLMTVAHGKQHTTFRSKSPELVLQEFWAMLAAYNLVRDLMFRAAKQAGFSPLELSFTDSLQVIEGLLQKAQTATASERPRLFLQMLKDLAECRLDRFRRLRSFPRVIKVKMSKFPVKRRTHKGTMLQIEILLPSNSKRFA